MEPKLPSPNFSPEQAPGQYESGREQIPLPPTPEMGIERGAEHMEQRGEAAPAAISSSPVLPTPILVPVPTTVLSDDATSGVLGDDLPSVAGDDDVIEKEWVDKAKKIILETRDDPHRREQEVSKLQADYLRKRYGKELGSFDV